MLLLCECSTFWDRTLVVVVICRYVYLTCSSAAREHSRCPCFVRAYLAICNHVRFSHLLCDFASTACNHQTLCVCFLWHCCRSICVVFFPVHSPCIQAIQSGRWVHFSVSYFSTHMFNRIRPPEYILGNRFFLSTLPFDALFFSFAQRWFDTRHIRFDLLQFSLLF